MTLDAGNGEFGTFDFNVMCSSAAPSAAPTTPSPTDPVDAIECGGGTVSGEFNDELLTFTVTVDTETNLYFVASIDDDVPRSVVLRDANGLIVQADGDQSDPDGAVNGEIAVEDVSPGTYFLEIDGDDDEVAPFEVTLECYTSDPTADPSNEPTASPTEVPVTPNPTTLAPSTSPTTPAPVDMLAVECNDGPITGTLTLKLSIFFVL